MWIFGPSHGDEQDALCRGTSRGDRVKVDTNYIINILSSDH
jgi:hypothetical protein